MTQAVMIKGCWKGYEYMAEIRAPFAMQLSGSVFGPVRVIDPKDRTVRPLADFPEKVRSGVHCSAWMKMAKARIPNLATGPSGAKVVGMVLVDGTWPGVVPGYAALQQVVEAGTEHFMTVASLSWPAMVGPDTMYYAIQPAGWPPGIYMSVAAQPRDVLLDVPFSPEYDDDDERALAAEEEEDEEEAEPPQVMASSSDEDEKKSEEGDENDEKKSEDDVEAEEERMPRRMRAMALGDDS
jgi:hypothetical protein